MGVPKINAKLHQVIIIKNNQTMANNAGNTLLAFLLGAVVGGSVGILFAPDEGRKTRRRFKQSFDETADNLKHRLEDFNDELKVKAKNFKGTLEDNVENLLSNSSHKAEEIIEVLEKKLEQLKKANAKLQK